MSVFKCRVQILCTTQGVPVRAEVLFSHLLPSCTFRVSVNATRPRIHPQCVLDVLRACVCAGAVSLASPYSTLLQRTSSAARSLPGLISSALRLQPDEPGTDMRTSEAAPGDHSGI
uniref:Uncharacterized protein n=1 Tax=Knipowitschia caucasica TaxID=637954 RepID=A0AAV2IVS9_KNICA